MKIAVIQFPGTNCEFETLVAVKEVGMEGEIFRWNRPEGELSGFDGFIIPGGFSYQDRVRAGAIASKEPVLKALKEEAELSKPILGICNGFQILAHRAHASTAVIAQFFPNDKMFGYLIESELESLDKVLKNPQRPLTAIMGGAKVSTKITIIENLLSKVDNLILGGGMTFTFIKANGGNIGNSICEEDFLDTARNIEKLAKEKGVKIYMATDVLAADAFAPNANTQITQANEIPEGWQGLDAGPESIAIFKEVIENSGTILWNGPVGVFEFEKFAGGSKAVGQAIVDATQKGAFSLVGGGDSVACVNKFGFADGVSYISTAGGALLEYLEGQILPGVAAVRGE